MEIVLSIKPVCLSKYSTICCCSFSDGITVGVFLILFNDKLNIVEQRYNEISDLIIQPNIIKERKRYVELNKEYKDLGLIIEKKKVFEELLLNIEEAENICKIEDDQEMIEMATEQFSDSKQKIEKLKEEIRLLLIPKDPEDSKNVVKFFLWSIGKRVIAIPSNMVKNIILSISPFAAAEIGLVGIIRTKISNVESGVFKLV